VRATHTVNQLLSLARAEGNSAGAHRQPCDLARLTIEVVREAVPRAIEKRIDLGYDGVDPGSRGVVPRATRPCSRSWCATWSTTRSTTRPRGPNAPA
jgi:signal transduction histidine kinase